MFFFKLKSKLGGLLRPWTNAPCRLSSLLAELRHGTNFRAAEITNSNPT